MNLKSNNDLVYRTLSRSEIGLLVQLDRTETIERVYYLRDGELVLEQEHWGVPDWSQGEKERRIAALQDSYDGGATFYGAFKGSCLVGMALLEHNPLPSGTDRLNLSGLWVSCPYRARGVGSVLVGLVRRDAERRGARKLYVSATPSENTVNFYLSRGFRLADPVDPGLYVEEPQDIHLEMDLE